MGDLDCGNCDCGGCDCDCGDCDCGDCDCGDCDCGNCDCKNCSCTDCCLCQCCRECCGDFCDQCCNILTCMSCGGLLDDICDSCPNNTCLSSGSGGRRTHANGHVYTAPVVTQQPTLLATQQTPLSEPVTLQQPLPAHDFSNGIGNGGALPNADFSVPTAPPPPYDEVINVQLQGDGDGGSNRI